MSLKTRQSPKPDYAPHAELIAPARATAALWRLALSVTLFVALYVILLSLYFYSLAPDPNDLNFLEETFTGSSPRGVLSLLISFSTIIGGLWLVLILVHRRSIDSLIGPLRPTLRNLTRVSGALIVLNALLWLLPEPAIMRPQANLAFAVWARLLPLALFAIFIQIGAEELVFRGYLQSQLAARFRSPIVWMVLPALIFGALHYDPRIAGVNAPYVVLSAALFGLAAADLTARSGNLGAALAFHFINNIAAILIASPKGHLDGLSLYTYGFSMSDPLAMATWLPLDIMMILCSWLVARLAIRR